MQRWMAISLLVCSATGISALHPVSSAQEDQAQIQRKVLTRVAPAYPELARKTNIHGAVKLLAVVASDGKVKSTEVVGGNPVLAQAAVDAVRRWKYEAGPQPTKEVIELKFEIR
jgi:TonB family protein